jgi:hypothetical protein
MIRLVLRLIDALRALVRERSDVVLENMALRQQVATLAAKGGRPRITSVDRWLWTVLRRCGSRWTEVLVFVNPRPWCVGTAPASVAIGPGCPVAAGAAGLGHVRISAP